jgi:hypothetical protein|tara:strand:- start:308 stop:889 length:582 start_codon:yes stop_codon:yes gene_type:complete
MKKTDIDIDFADREKILKLIDCVPAMQIKDNEVRKHNSGVYVTAIPYDPINDCASIDYKSAEERGYFKLDFLNVNVYKLIKDEEHYQKMLEQEPPWERLKEKEFVEKIIHISNHYELIKNMEVNSIPRMAMFLAVIRPGKRHLLGQKWGKIAADIWSIPDDESYYFKKSHSLSYAVLVALHMNLINEKESLST